MRFYVGLHQPADAQHFGRCMISVNRLRNRKSPFIVNEWMMDSGAFTELARYGRYRDVTKAYARQVIHWADNGHLVAAVSQDYMCEPFIIKQTGLSVRRHQALTINRYLLIREEVGEKAYVMPVLQGYAADDYLRCADSYGAILTPGQWVGVGSVCKRNSKVDQVEQVLVRIKRHRPDLRLHGFGLKTTALESSLVRECLWSADSLAWSFAARYEGRDANDWHEAHAFAERIERQHVRKRMFQEWLFGPQENPGT